jgi:hypothetical protein
MSRRATASRRRKPQHGVALAESTTAALASNPPWRTGAAAFMGARAPVPRRRRAPNGPGRPLCVMATIRAANAEPSMTGRTITRPRLTRAPPDIVTSSHVPRPFARRLHDYRAKGLVTVRPTGMGGQCLVRPGYPLQAVASGAAMVRAAEKATAAVRPLTGRGRPA